METFERFENSLKEGLTHLHDPAFQPSPLLRQVLRCAPTQGVEAVQKALIKAIDELQPGDDTPAHARVWRLYRLLSYRYVQQFTQVEVAQRLNISLRHLRREQQQAIRVLAQRLWEQRPTSPPPAPVDAVPPPAQTGSWQTQVRQELVSLAQHAPGAVAEVRTAIDSAVKVGQALVKDRPIELRAQPVPANLLAAMHPSLLNQILVTAIEKLAQEMDSGEIVIAADVAGDGIELTVSGGPLAAPNLPQSDLIQEILAAQNGACRVTLHDSHVRFNLGLPSAHRIRVLVVDDNYDLVHWYRRYTAQTRYTLTHLPVGEAVFETVAQQQPDIIVLDVMLPDIDGWELLTRLHEAPETRTTPVIICSVVKREALALALGAALYLPKPVHRQQFIEALDQALARGSATAAKPEASTLPTAAPKSPEPS